MSDLLIKNARLNNGSIQDILVLNELVADIGKIEKYNDIPSIDAKGYFVTTPFVDSHFHLDATLSYGIPRVNQSGTLLDGIKLWGELKSN